MGENDPKEEKKPFFEAKPLEKEPPKHVWGSPKPTQDKCKCTNELEEKDLKIKELTETLQRLQAEFENYQKRSAKQNSEFVVVANASLMEQLLAVLDSLESGMQHNKELAPIQEQLYSTLKKNGLQKMEIKEGVVFDHNKMDCLMQECNEKLREGEVAKVLLNGYALNGKVLRHAKVSVAKAFEKKNEGQKGQEEKK